MPDRITPLYIVCQSWALLNIFSSPILAQTPFPDIIRPNRPQPPTLPSPQPLPPPENLLKPPSVPPNPQPAPDIPQKITIKKFEVIGNTVFSQQEIDKLLAPYKKRSLDFAELFQVRAAITQLYVSRGYITSGALIPPQTIKNGRGENCDR